MVIKISKPAIEGVLRDLQLHSSACGQRAREAIALRALRGYEQIEER